MSALDDAGGAVVCVLCGLVDVIHDEASSLRWGQHLALCDGTRPGTPAVPSDLGEVGRVAPRGVAGENALPRRSFLQDALDRIRASRELIDAAGRMHASGSSIAGEAADFLRDQGGTR